MKVKKILSLILAMVMVLSFMAMSASAATTEVQPRGTCPKCTYGYMDVYTKKHGDPITKAVKSCANSNIPHTHTTQEYYMLSTCVYCGYQTTYTYTITDCSKA